MKMILPDLYLLFDVGGTFLKGAAGTASGEILRDSFRSVPVDSAAGAGEILASFRELVSAVRTAVPGRIAGVGMTFPGPFDYNRGISRMTHKFASLRGLDMGEKIRQIPGVGDVPVKFVHDVTCLVSGEMRNGAARGFSNVAVVTLGTGLGFAVAVDGKVLRSPLGSPANSLWDSPYAGGILEDRISKRGIAARYRELSGRDGLSVKEIADAARAGDAAAAETFRETGGILGQILSDKAREYALECILFGGQISRSFDLLDGALSDGLAGVETLRHVGTVSDIDHAAFNGILAELITNV